MILRMLTAAAICLGAGAVELKIDHVTIAGQDLGALQKTFDAAGMKCEFGGKHINAMTEMAIASFTDGSYIELIAAQPGSSAAKHYWGRFIEQNAGVCAWAVSVKNLKAESGRLKQRGMDTSPAASGRQRPDGVALRWLTATVGPPPAGSYFPFLIEDTTDRSLRVYPSGKPSVQGMDGIALIVVAVRDLDAAVAKWREVFALGEPKRQQDAQLHAHLAWFPGTPVVLASAAQPQSPLTARIEKFGEAPFAIVLRAKQLPTGVKAGRASWFGHPVSWFDPATLKGTQIGIITEKLN